ncbi:hypothetical protein KR51_00003270 [Rubidibacter lacunae KORDI 51-2]|uniref:Uncharacterized protein n=1 Tax=Rubidibacter lacunae KORDI 51-2 TaxID=582515 RepID=U5DQW8_9CHRO|nr:hypothetical protein KR51_00003270 [Rubidibacter lacunae KORDI 51-2]
MIHTATALTCVPPFDFWTPQPTHDSQLIKHLLELDAIWKTLDCGKRPAHFVRLRWRDAETKLKSCDRLRAATGR